jgi:hypothetical protein
MGLVEVIEHLPQAGLPLAGLVVLLALPMAAVAMAAAERLRAVVLLSGGAYAIGTVALVCIPGLHGPFPHDPVVLAVSRAAWLGGGTAYLLGVLALLGMIVSRWVSLPEGVRLVMPSLAGVLMGLGAPIALRGMLSRRFGIWEFYGDVYPVAVLGVFLVPGVAGLLLLVASRKPALVIAVNAAAAVAALFSAARAAAFLTYSTGSGLVPTPPICVTVALVALAFSGGLILARRSPTNAAPGSPAPRGGGG